MKAAWGALRMAVLKFDDEAPLSSKAAYGFEVGRLVVKRVIILLTVALMCGTGLCQSPTPAPEGVRGALRERIRERVQGKQNADGAAAGTPWTRKARAKKNDGESPTLAGLRVSVWRPAPSAGRVPLVIFSHGFHGMSTQSTFLTAALAEHGYLVLAPNHRDALDNGLAMDWLPQVSFGRPAEWSDQTYRDRADDIRNLVKALREEKPWSEMIDWSRVALAGHSLGGYTVLGLAGAWPSWKLPEVKAVLAYSPYTMPFVVKPRLAALGVPVMYQGGTRDFGITPVVGRPGGAYDLTAAPAYFVDFEKAGIWPGPTSSASTRRTSITTAWLFWIRC